MDITSKSGGIAFMNFILQMKSHTMKASHHFTESYWRIKSVEVVHIFRVEKTMMGNATSVSRRDGPATGHHEKWQGTERTHLIPAAAACQLPLLWGFWHSYGLVIGLGYLHTTWATLGVSLENAKELPAKLTFSRHSTFYPEYDFLCRKEGVPKWLAFSFILYFSGYRRKRGSFILLFLYLPLSGTPSECLLKFGITLCVKKIFLFLIFIRTLKRGHHRLAQDPFHSRTEAVCLPPPQPIWSLVSPHPLFLPRVFALEQPKHAHGTQAHMYLSETWDNEWSQILKQSKTQHKINCLHLL